MIQEPLYRIQVCVESTYVEEHSNPQEESYAFAYHIIIRNIGTGAAKLLGRHWFVTDANNEVVEVQGLGVVGEQPRLTGGQEFTYTSGTTLKTPVGCMHGSYTMVTDMGEEFEVEIPPFRLAIPRLVH